MRAELMWTSSLGLAVGEGRENAAGGPLPVAGGQGWAGIHACCPGLLECAGAAARPGLTPLPLVAGGVAELLAAARVADDASDEKQHLLTSPKG